MARIKTSQVKDLPSPRARAPETQNWNGRGQNTSATGELPNATLATSPGPPTVKPKEPNSIPRDKI